MKADLHFRKGHARTLRNIRARLAAGNGTKAQLDTLDLAAKAARAGLPLRVESKAELIADGLEALGAPRPRIVPVDPLAPGG